VVRSPVLARPPVAVIRRPATGLKYDPPTAVAPLELVAAACVSPPCTSVTFKILATTAVQLRGAALNLPLDPTKVSFADGSFGLGSRIPAAGAAVSKATLGSGALQDVLVLGIALKGSSTAPAQDVTLNAGDELAHFTLALLSGSGAGPAFDGAATAGSAFKASIQSASGVRPIRLRSARSRRNRTPHGNRDRRAAPRSDAQGGRRAAPLHALRAAHRPDLCACIEEGIQLVDTRHEQAAAHAADATARLTRGSASAPSPPVRASPTR